MRCVQHQYSIYSIILIEKIPTLKYSLYASIKNKVNGSLLKSTIYRKHNAVYLTYSTSL